MPPLLEAHDLTATFPGPDGGPPVQVLRGVSLRVEPGELVSIVGPSGSGKSTLLYCLSGLQPATSGTVQLLGQPLSTLRRSQLAKLRRGRIGFVFQSYNLIPSLTARENVALPARLARRDLTAADVDRALAQVGLAERGGHRPAALSGGQQQRVAIARVLATGPEIVFADEPTGALDTTAGAQVLDLLRATAAGSRSVVLVTHDVAAAARADRVLVLRDGLVSRELTRPTPEQVFEEITAKDSVG
ncbi:ABC transporter related protein [Kribbella flavida DSM 17836]|uniref:ABC transporter related protein n=1 Tax=Kribbella flavida (strain DSM 17836 / JCM 10339 / NBRC 14399) TaxID=479435 RepID=D2PR92_KRIFD|nr:ABC transporter ATP-binding protein [Kribbella flavida]ADB33040.1 ABC transporter related protein [Kribbella flavida DSM 17836]